VDFTFSDEQDELRRTVRGVVERGGGFDELAELGIVSLLVPEEHGGGGAGLVDMVPVLEELGRALVPGPFTSSAVFATIASLRLGLADQLTSLASGTTRGTIAVDEQGHGDPVDRVRTRATRKAGRWYLTGVQPVVPDGDAADWVLVPARTQSGLQTFLVEAPRGTPVESWDLERRVARLELDERAAEPVGPDGDHTPIWRRIVDDCTVAVCAELIGSMERANLIAVEYAKNRVQFDRPIATFQVIKHKLADCLHRLELSRVGTHYAAWASDAEAPDRARAAAMAGGYVAESAIFVSGECIQVHGGVGFSWDCEAHRHYRKAKQADLLLGAQGWHRSRLADLVLSA
jgi:alkylation response protein AidB-like acyl-CoA dehydrogenase